MAPLPTNLRAGAWANLEQAINELTETEEELYVISGPLYEVEETLTTRSLVGSLPSRYFKVVATEDNYASFVFDADLPIHAKYCDQIDTISGIQQFSGLSLFPELEAELTPGLYSGLRCQHP